MPDWREMMNLDQLDKTLKTLTKSEIMYKNGYKKTWSNPLSINHLDTVCFTSVPNYTKINGLDISIKKNSRYNPIPLHIHDSIEINYMYSGCCHQQINGVDIVLKTSQVLLIDVNTPHSIGNLCDNDIMINILISKKYLNTNLFNHLSKDSVLSTFFINSMNKRTQLHKYILFESEKSRRLPIFINEFLCETYDPSVNSTDILTNLFGLIVAELINVYESDMEKEDLKSSKTSVIPIMHYIEKNFQTCTLESISNFFNLNPTYLSSLLKKNVGISYKQLVQNQKLKYAAKLLKNTDMSVAEIANDTGYENVNFFYRKFKDTYGCTPGDFRGRS
jgi:AraC-type DNA-binding domain-containing proteins